MTGFEIRRVMSGSTELLSRVADDVFDGPVSPTSAAGFLAASGHAMFVALKDGVVVGQIRGVIHQQPDGEPQLYIDNLGVAPAEQRQGLGRLLLVSLLTWGGQLGCTLCWVATETDNAEALGFYEATGFSRKTLAWLELELTAP